MADNRIVTYQGPGEVSVEDTEYPKLEVPKEVADAMGMSVEAPHAAILEIVSTNICGSDQHMVRGRTTAPVGQTLGHEITGKVVEMGSDVQFIKEGDICSVPFNIACGRCRNCRERQTGVCLNVNPARAGSAYGYVDMGGWKGGQANYVLVPFADFNLLPFPDPDQALEKILDLTMLSDIFPTGYHGAVKAGVTTGSTVYVAGAGPVGLAAAYSAQILGAAVVIVGDLNDQRLQQARSFGCETINVGEDTPIDEQIASIVGIPEVDCAVDAVGFEATGHGSDAGEAPAVVLNSIQAITRAGGSLGIPGPLRDRRPGGGRPGRPGRYAQDKLRPRLGQEPRVLHRPVPGPAVQPRAYDGDPQRQGPHRRRGKRHGNRPRRRPAGLPGLRQRRGREVRPQPERLHKRLAKLQNRSCKLREAGYTPVSPFVSEAIAALLSFT